VGIPVIANGDITDADGARRCLTASGADAVMVGRAAVGRPWLVGQIGAALEGRIRPVPTPETMAAVAVEHYEGLLSLYGRETGIRHARKHLAAAADIASASGFTFGAKDRLSLVTSEEPREVKSLLQRIYANPSRKAA
jgi:tRNA-dihydrouridine synthase